MAVNAPTGEEENKLLSVAISEKALWKKRKLEPEIEKLVGMGTQKGQEQQDRCERQRKTEQRQGGEGLRSKEVQESLSERRQCGKEVFWSVSQFHCRDQDRQAYQQKEREVSWPPPQPTPQAVLVAWACDGGCKKAKK